METVIPDEVIAMIFASAPWRLIGLNHRLTELAFACIDAVDIRWVDAGSCAFYRGDKYEIPLETLKALAQSRHVKARILLHGKCHICLPDKYEAVSWGNHCIASRQQCIEISHNYILTHSSLPYYGIHNTQLLTPTCVVRTTGLGDIMIQTNPDYTVAAIEYIRGSEVILLHRHKKHGMPIPLSIGGGRNDLCSVRESVIYSALQKLDPAYAEAIVEANNIIVGIYTNPSCNRIVELANSSSDNSWGSLLEVWNNNMRKPSH